jgi:YD repeat-containing protein
MKRFLLCLVLIAALLNIAPPFAMATEIQNWVYVTGNSDNETRTSVAQGSSTGFGVANLQNIVIGEQVTLTENSVHILDVLGRVWGWGRNGREVGIGSADKVTQARVLPIMEKVIQIESGTNHTMALSEGGKLYAWGWNGHGQIGIGDYVDYATSSNVLSPVQITIPGGRAIKSIAAGGYQSFAIATDNTIWGWGINNFYSVLGTGGYSSVYTPTLIRLPAGFVPTKLVTNGGRYTLVLSNSGSVIGWGSNGSSGFGLGVYDKIESPTLIFPQTANIIDIAVNGAATYVLSASGIVLSAGYNGYGQLGSETHPGGVKFSQVALPKTFVPTKLFGSDASNAWAVNVLGETYAWGAGSNDALGTGYSGSVFTPMKIDTLKNLGVLDMAGNSSQTFAIVSNKQRIQAEAKAAAELKAKQEAEAKAAVELKAKQEAEAKAAVELKAKQEAEAKAAAELKAKQEAEAKAAADKTALLKAQSDLTAANAKAVADRDSIVKLQGELAAANASLADSQKTNRDLNAQLTAIEGQFLVVSESVSAIQIQVSQLNTKLSTALKSLNTTNVKLRKICSAKPKPKGC